MESFVDPNHHKVLDKITIKEGETAIVALKKPDFGGADALDVNTDDWDIAACHQSFHLKDTSKKAYNDHYDMTEMYDYFIPVESKGYQYFQIGGRFPGTTTLRARVKGGSSRGDYAESIDVEIKDNPKHVFFTSTIGSPPVTFEKLWSNHPLVQNGGRRISDSDKVCQAKVAGPCMINFSTALERSGVDFKGMHGSVCGLRDKAHKHHFTNPYDFELWKKYNPSHYQWAATKQPFQKEPMPGLAAFDFMIGRQGIVVFWNYWDGHGVSAMFGGHIDLWNKDVMGNSLAFERHTQGEAAFFRARKISFWPLDEHKRGR